MPITSLLSGPGPLRLAGGPLWPAPSQRAPSGLNRVRTIT